MLPCQNGLLRDVLHLGDASDFTQKITLHDVYFIHHEEFVNFYLNKDKIFVLWRDVNMNESGITEAQKEYILRTRKAREGAGKDREEISAYLGVSPSTYANWEVPERKRPMPQKYIARFCHYTAVNEKWLLRGEGDMTSPLLEKIEKLNKEHLESIETIIDAYLQKQET